MLVFPSSISLYVCGFGDDDGSAGMLPVMVPVMVPVIVADEFLHPCLNCFCPGFPSWFLCFAFFCCVARSSRPGFYILVSLLLS